MYRKYRDSLINTQYLYRGKKYRDVPVHWCIVAGLIVMSLFPCSWTLIRAVLNTHSLQGSPMADLLKWHHATVTTCHSKTKDLADVVSLTD